MRILYVGDVMGELGLRTLEAELPKLKLSRNIDVVITQAENVTDGKGIVPADFKRLQMAGVDFCTGGNWSLHQAEIIPLLNDPNVPIVRPANYPTSTPGLGYKYFASRRGPVLVVSLLGQIVGRDAGKPMDNPLHVIDRILENEKDKPRVATVVNFHGDFSSEKKVIGYYLDGRVTMIVGDHWHIPTADAMLLPKGTAHQTDVGMCGSLDSSLGVKLDTIIKRWHDGTVSRNVLETAGRTQFNALLVESDDATGLAKSVEPINIIR